ncbi:MAG: SGNH/GDSL hydrolase family protein [Candidatus Eiseniibacteriota bacterium]|jgi:lysophospholipase L1-like esterase
MAATRDATRPGGDGRRTWRGRGAAALLVVASTLVALLLVELALRVAGFSFALYPERVEFGWPDPEIMTRLYRPDPDLLWVPRDYAETIERGLAERPELVCMGCSCTAWSTYPELLAERVARARPAAHIAYLNLGVGGWSSYQGRRQLERDVVRLGPRVVTLFYGWNDHWIGFGIEDREVARVTSSFYRQLRALRVVQLVDRTRVAVAHGRRDTLPERVSEQDFRANLEAMVTVARRHGIVPVLVTAPTSHERGREPSYLLLRWLRDLDDLVPLHRRYVEIVRAVAADLDVPLCDLAAFFDTLPRDLVRERYFGADGIHPTADGDRVIAGRLFECLERHGLLDVLAAGD